MKKKYIDIDRALRIVFQVRKLALLFNIIKGRWCALVQALLSCRLHGVNEYMNTW